MPFLRSLDDVSSSLELRSSKTLIGSATATCDVVISGDKVLELHALLNLAPDKASAKLVPFSTTEAGVCFVNDVVVPREGAVVVHGDRVAFGSPRTVFLFELTPHPQMTAVAQQSIDSINDQAKSVNANRSFRRALDTLRGDRKISTPNASVVASIQSNFPAARNRHSISSSASSAPSSTSKDQLSKFLLEASTDSLLSGYVERKLKQRRSRPSSVSSSNQSLHDRRGRQSREERNQVEVEKLRLSQRIREVNDVLNGDMEFQESYLSPSAKTSKSRKPRWAGVLHSVEDMNADQSDDTNEDEEEDELPTMMEKQRDHLAAPVPASLSVSIQTEHSEHPGNHYKSEEESELLNYSLESMPGTEASQSQHRTSSQRQSSDPPKARDFFSKAMSLGLNDLTRSHSRPINTERQEAAKTALQEKLINQRIRLKQNELFGETFVRWKRGLRIQSQNRVRKAQQLEEVSEALGNLHRDQAFCRWRDHAATSSQVLICRLEAFQQRCMSRLVQKCWAALLVNRLSAALRTKMLRGLVMRKAMVVRLLAFRRWEQFARSQSVQKQLDEVQRLEQCKLDVHLERISERHYHQRRVLPLLSQTLRRWKAIADLHKKQRQILRRLLVHGASKLVQRALIKWNEAASIYRRHMKMKKQTEREIQQLKSHLTTQQDQAQSSLREDHALQVQKLMAMIEEKDQQLEHLKRQQRTETLEKAAVKNKCEQDLHSFLEDAIVKCDEQIEQTSDHLENLLQSAEVDVLGARFGAAQFLVDSMLQQKIQNANERVHLQLASLPGSQVSPSEDPTNDVTANLSSNGRYLYDMIQQRLTRLQQLHHSLAKLAAVSDSSSSSLDPERLQHSSFLAEALFQRQQSHLLAVMTLLHHG